MSEFTLRISSNKGELGISVKSDFEGGGDLKVETPEEVFLKIIEVMNQFSLSTGNDETESEEAVKTCRVCGCTDEDCSQCVEKTGEPCSWVEGEEDLCSACVEAEGEGEPEEEHEEEEKLEPEEEEAPAEADEDDLSTNAVAEKLGISTANLYNKISTGNFSKADKKIGIKNYWSKETVDNWIWEHKENAGD